MYICLGVWFRLSPFIYCRWFRHPPPRGGWLAACNGCRKKGKTSEEQAEVGAGRGGEQCNNIDVV